MNFTIDKQSLDELNLPGRIRQGSVQHLFNQVKTRGGEKLLDRMFREPLTDVAAINHRSNIFRYFQEVNQKFPFDAQQVSLMREYFDESTSPNALLVLGRTMIKKMMASLTREEGYKKMIQGLQATIVTLNRCHRLVEVLRDPGPFSGRVNEILAILSDEQIEKLRNTDIYQAIPLRTLAYYDHSLKGRLYQQMEIVLAFIDEVDVYIAVSDVARSKGFCYAKALPAAENMLSATGLRHPCVENAIGNDIALNRNSNVLFLTGANMAGKSTLMKSIGIGLYLAHIGFPVAAESFGFSVREGMYTSINVADNIGLGYSHFYAEVVRVKHAAEAAASGKKLLMMFDELFKGTNVKDAFDGTLAVTEEFSEYRQCIFIVSTHIIEVGEALRSRPNIHFVYMPTVMDGPYPRYTYQLQEGITEDRQGMMIIRNEGILEMLAF